MDISALDRLERVEARAAIMHLESLYCVYWDESRAAEWASLFTEDGYFQRVDVPGRPGHVQRGRQELESFCERLQVGHGRFHMLHTVDIQFDGSATDTATSRITFECMTTATGPFPKPGLVTGFYNTEYVRHGEDWLIAAKRERQVFFAEGAYYGLSGADDQPSSGR